MAQAKLAHERSCLRAFEPALLNIRDAVADQSSISVDTHRLLDASLQRSARDFFMLVLDHVNAEGSVFCANMSDQCDIIATTVHQQHEDTC